MDMRTRMEGPDGFASSSSQMQAYASRTLVFLQAIETTIRSLATDTAVVSTLVNEARETLSQLEKSEQTADIDPNGRICDLLEKAAASAERTYNVAVQRRQAARDDKALTEEDGVVDAYTAFIAAIADFHNVVEDLRDTVATLDASRLPGTGKSFTSADELIEHLLNS